MTGTFSCTLKFIVKDCDPNTGEPDDEGYEDEYVLEDVEVTVADHVQRVMKPNFSASWEEVGPENELEDTYALSTMKTLEGKQWGLYVLQIEDFDGRSESHKGLLFTIVFTLTVNSCLRINFVWEILIHDDYNMYQDFQINKKMHSDYSIIPIFFVRRSKRVIIIINNVLKIVINFR